MIKVATILPIPFLRREGCSDYHMCLAHLLDNRKYREFFKQMTSRGNFVLMDNGVVETGQPMGMNALITRANRINASQICLPDAIRDQRRTLKLHREAIEWIEKKSPDSVSMMAIPQGKNLEEWIFCCKEIVSWASNHDCIEAIGVTKFLEGMVRTRAEAICAVPTLMQSKLDIHLLGTLGSDPTEVYTTCNTPRLRGRIRGTDSGISAIYTQAGLILGTAERPRIDLSFLPNLRGYDKNLLTANITMWKRAVWTGGYA